MRIWLDKTVDQEFLDLGNQGHKGTLNDRQYSYLDNAGYYGALGDKFAAVGGADITAPVLSGNSFNDTDDEATFSTTEGGTFVWATHLTTETLTADGSGGWTGNLLESGTDTVATSGETTISAAYTATTGTGGESRKFSYYVRDAAGNDSNVITESFTVNSSYTENYVTGGYFQGGLGGDSAQFELVARVTPRDLSANRYFLQVDGRTDIYIQTSGALRVSIRDTTGSTYILQKYGAANDFVVGTEALLYIGCNSTTGENYIYINNVLSESSTTTGAAIDLTRTTHNSMAGCLSGNMDVSEYYFHAGNNVGPSVFWNGGVKANLATLAGLTPRIYFGNGQAATAWAAATNLGSTSPTAAGSWVEA